ncbi:hypothetical protein CWI85_30460, partial [Streptomyces albidoflavus]
MLVRRSAQGLPQASGAPLRSSRFVRFGTPSETESLHAEVLLRTAPRRRRPAPRPARCHRRLRRGPRPRP